MLKKYKNRILILAVIVILIVLVFGVFQFFYLRKAHSTFENYYAFRGCTRLLAKTDDFGFCETKSGEIIKIVKIDNKWFLDGDGPGIW